jgi:threonine/homoserine/homoserine lactone efflux protein
MVYFYVFAVGFVFSFLGSIPPGTLNLCVLQLGLEKKTQIAFRFSLAVAFIEYPYAWIGVEFEHWITAFPSMITNFKLITAVVMLVMGTLTVWSSNAPVKAVEKFNASGFRRGLILSILNPMAIPFWIGVTAYFKAQGWLALPTKIHLHLYVLGTAFGVLFLLALFTYLASRFAPYVQKSRIIKLLPGVTLLVLGFYALAKFLLG